MAKAQFIYNNYLQIETTCSGLQLTLSRISVVFAPDWISSRLAACVVSSPCVLKCSKNINVYFLGKIAIKKNQQLQSIR